MPKASKNKSNPLNIGRPPLRNTSTKVNDISTKAGKSVNARRKSSKATRTLINTHHQLQKSRAAAISKGDQNLVSEIDEQIQQLGGLEAYQAASLTGQDKDRGGDSSEKLVEWLRDYGLVGAKRTVKDTLSLRVLEVGALSSQNAISGMIGKGIESVRRVDLHSQDLDAIEEIDFMDLPIPEDDSAKFDIISLSLVLNYVPNVEQRGEMLRRTTPFLRRPQGHENAQTQTRNKLPLLFMVLPLPCLKNSRYMTYDHFIEIMASLGYTEVEHHDSQKLTYMLFNWTGAVDNALDQPHAFRKLEINPGKSRNNFAIVLSAFPGRD